MAAVAGSAADRGGLVANTAVSVCGDRRAVHEQPDAGSDDDHQGAQLGERVRDAPAGEPQRHRPRSPCARRRALATASPTADRADDRRRTAHDDHGSCQYRQEWEQQRGAAVQYRALLGDELSTGGNSGNHHDGLGTKRAGDPLGATLRRCIHRPHRGEPGDGHRGDRDRERPQHRACRLSECLVVDRALTGDEAGVPTHDDVRHTDADGDRDQLLERRKGTQPRRVRAHRQRQRVLSPPRSCEHPDADRNDQQAHDLGSESDRDEHRVEGGGGLFGPLDERAHSARQHHTLGVRVRHLPTHERFGVQQLVGGCLQGDGRIAALLDRDRPRPGEVPLHERRVVHRRDQRHRGARIGEQ